MFRSARASLIVLPLMAIGTPVAAAPPSGAKPAPARPAASPPLPVANPKRSHQAQGPTTVAGATGEAATTAPAGKDDGASANGAPGTPPKSDPVLSPESLYVLRLDAAIAPVRDWAPSVDDAVRLRDAVRAVAGGDLGKGRALKEQLADPVARKLVDWVALRNGYGAPADFVAFAEANPDWPDRELLRRRAEEQLFVQGGESHKIIAFFGKDEPQTGAGYAALASAYLAEKDEAKAKALAAKAWREYELAPSLETGFLERFKSLLTEADHRRRLDRILVDSVRFSAARSERAAIARRVIPLLAEGERKAAEARLAVFLKAKNAGALLAALPAEGEGATNWGLAYQRVQHLRAQGKMEEVWKILSAAPADADKLVSPDDWWAERRSAAYAALRAGKPEVAYAIVRDPGPLSVNPLKDATFMAGWLALRYLKKPEAALAHFQASRASADGPLTRARGDYWSGRACEALGRSEEARALYAAAAKLFDTFHGQLARHKIEPGGVTLPAMLPAAPSAEEAARFNALGAVRAAVWAMKSGLDRSLVRALLGHLRYHLERESELAMLAHLAEALGDTQWAIRIGKTAIARGMNLVAYAYPVHPFPNYKPLRDPPEMAMLLGIARQESEFNTQIVSTAGARGLLQVMPITARHICRDHKVKCDIPRLLTDKSYNAMIASAYVGDRMAEFSGNYVLTLAAYNAGPGRAREWIRAFGDPRDGKIDPIDWIELIPFEETREYVKKVLSNIQVYRARLGEPNPLRLADDLKLRRVHKTELPAGAVLAR
jgi:soluble lytic murein transglycosylase